MKIHSTQNLNLKENNQQLSTNILNRDFRLKYYSEQVSPSTMNTGSLHNSSLISFGKGKGSAIRDSKKIISAVKKVVGDIKKEASPEIKRGDSILDSPFFDGLLNIVDYETIIMALVAAIACGLRGGIIANMPAKTDTDKMNNKWAGSHSWASGIIGIFVALLITAPFKHGQDYVMKNMKQHLNEDTLKRLYPHLDLKTIVKDGKRVAISEWKDLSGNKFIDDIKGCEKLPKIKNLADVSESTFKNILHVDVDFASQKGKSFNDVVLKDGRKLYDAIDMSALGIRIEESGMDNVQILLKDFDKEYLKLLVKDAESQENSIWKNLNVDSVYDNNGLVKDFRQWKDNNGKQWKLDLDQIGVSSAYETASYKPRVSGAKRYDKKKEEYKFVAYQKNGKDGNLGTAITSAMADNDASNDGLVKLLTWLPDLVTRIPIAMATIALIPWVLRNLLHIQKASDKQKQVQNNQINEQSAKISDVEKTNTTDKKKEDKKVAFKGRNLKSSFLEWLGSQIGKFYGKPLIENSWVHTVSKKLAELPGNVTQHMTAFGSLITSSAYIHQTLTKKEIEPDDRRTLAVNQGLCFFIPTLLAYKVDSLLNNWVKKRVEYRYVGLKERKIDIGKLEKQDMEKEIKNLSRKTKGIRTLASIAIFTVIYRFITPIAVTPLANKLGGIWNAKKAEKRKAALEAKKNQEQTKAA